VFWRSRQRGLGDRDADHQTRSLCCSVGEKSDRHADERKIACAYGLFAKHCTQRGCIASGFRNIKCITGVMEGLRLHVPVGDAGSDGWQNTIEAREVPVFHVVSKSCKFCLRDHSSDTLHNNISRKDSQPKHAILGIRADFFGHLWALPAEGRSETYKGGPRWRATCILECELHCERKPRSVVGQTLDKVDWGSRYPRPVICLHDGELAVRHGPLSNRGARIEDSSHRERGSEKEIGPTVCSKPPPIWHGLLLIAVGSIAFFAYVALWVLVGFWWRSLSSSIVGRIIVGHGPNLLLDVEAAAAFSCGKFQPILPSSFKPPASRTTSPPDATRSRSPLQFSCAFIRHLSATRRSGGG
jgi:hypothetical protein